MCGMTRAADIAYAASLGVDAIGLIFYPKSSRCVSLSQAKALLQDLPPLVDTVAVLVNPDSAFVETLLAELDITYLQFHGEETPAFCQQFDKPYIKAIPAASQEAIEQSVQAFTGATALLLDTPSATNKGGSGLVFDWQIIPKALPKPCFLAGGLNASNVLAATRTVQPYAVDVCSGVEASPGIKDPQKMSQFINALWG